MSLNVRKTLLKAKGLARKGAIEEAAALYNAVLEAFPRNKEAGRALAALGQQSAQGTNSNSFAPREQVEPLVRLLNARRYREVVEHGGAALGRYANDPLLHNLVGTACVGLKQFEAALPNLREAVRLKPGYAEAHSNLGSALSRLGKNEDAIASFERAIQFAPNDADTHYNLGNTLRASGRPHDAIGCFQRATQLAPNHYMAHYNLGGALLYTGALEEALAAYDKAVEIEPENTEALSNRLVCLSEMDVSDGKKQLELATAYGEQLSARVAQQYDQWGCSAESKKLSIGFVSGDFRSHPVGYFLEGVLSHIDRERLELTAYFNNTHSDATTSRLRALFDHWTVIAGVDDDAAARIVHADSPHILVDLTGHLIGGRLGLFARKPAPVQLTWLGYWATTGVPQIDYKLGDKFVTPPGMEAWFSETVWRLPHAVLCFTPPSEDVSVGPLPALANGCITFGCFNRRRKVTAEVIATWAEILNAVPGARLFLKNRALDEASVVDELTGRFASHGVGPDRLILEGPSPREQYFEAYRRVDIALDPFPYPGGTTSAEALWMGVPVLTRKGTGSPLSGQGESVLHFSGLPEWVAEDREDYVAKAVAFAGDTAALARLREGMREQVIASDFFNAPQFAEDFQSTMHAIWTHHQQRD